MQSTKKNFNLFVDLLLSFKNYSYWLVATWIDFLVSYRKTAIGPLWLMLNPIVFVFFIGFLYSHVLNMPVNEFIPYLGIGYVTWTLLSYIVNGASKVFFSNKSYILQSDFLLTNLIFRQLSNSLLTYVHQLVATLLLLVVFFGFSASLWSIIQSLFGVFLILINGSWLMVIMGVLGARYRDIPEVVQALMRIAFLATPIIWMPSAEGTGRAVMSLYVQFNPFYHFLSLVREPLLVTPTNQTIYLSYGIVFVITIVGFFFASRLYSKVGAKIPLWVY